MKPARNHPPLPPRWPSRRAFLRTAAGSAVAGAWAGLDPARFAHAAGNGTIRVGLVGCGARGAGAAVNALGCGGDVRLVALADLFQERINGVLGTLGARPEKGRVNVPGSRQFVGFDAYERLLASGEVDAVLLAAPGGFRPLHLEAAARHGKPCFLEKPVAVDAPGLRQVATANERLRGDGKPVLVGLQDRFQAKTLALLERIRSGALGTLETLECSRSAQLERLSNQRRAAQEKRVGRSLSELEFQCRTWLGFSWLSGDWILEGLIHHLDLCTLVMGTKPLRASGVAEQRERRTSEFANVADFLHADLEYPSGARMSAEMSCLASRPNHWSIRITGEKGIANFGDHSLANRDGKPVWKFQGPGNDDPYQEEMRQFIGAIREGTALNNLDTVIESHWAAILGRTAAYRRQTLNMAEIVEGGDRLFPDPPTALDGPPPVLPDRFGDYEFPARPLPG